MPVETNPSGHASLDIRLIGQLAVSRDGVAITLPASRKVRALLAYLALAPQAVTRGHLCELLWDVPSDPRGELRWCLSKLRSIVDAPKRRRVETREDAVSLDLSDCFVDAREILQAAQHGFANLSTERRAHLSTLFNGEFLDGLEIDRNPGFNNWLTAQRRRFRSCHVALLEQLAGAATGDDAFEHLEKWLELAPFDLRVHEALLRAFAARGRVREGEEHLEATARLFEGEGLDYAPVRSIWLSARKQGRLAPKPAPAEVLPALNPEDGRSDIVHPAPRRASVAVMPFKKRSSATIAVHGGPADGLAYDVITRLAKLRSLFVIAQGTVFALSERGIGPEDAGRMLNVEYVVSGWVRRHGSRISLTVELTETRTARIVWTDVFDHTVDGAFLVLDDIGNAIVASIANEIEANERNRAILKPPNSLDAWEAHHRGLWHMYRFNKADNEQARHYFETAIRLDPTFSRPYAGLSFTHFQNAFQGWASREPEIEQALGAAAQSLMVDDRDPAAHLAMGRALWLRGSHDQSVIELERSIDLSPNFALGHYTLAFVHSQGGDPQAAVTFSDRSRNLSPFDPLLFGMLGARAMALVRLGRFGEAADWGVKAAARPNAHPHILAIAAYSLALAGRTDEARAYVRAIRARLPRYSVEDFLTAMQFDPDGAALFRQGARKTDD